MMSRRRFSFDTFHALTLVSLLCSNASSTAAAAAAVFSLLHHRSSPRVYDCTAVWLELCSPSDASLLATG